MKHAWCESPFTLSLSAAIMGRDKAPPLDSIGEFVDEVTARVPLTDGPIHADHIDALVILTIVVMSIYFVVVVVRRIQIVLVRTITPHRRLGGIELWRRKRIQFRPGRCVAGRGV